VAGYNIAAVKEPNERAHGGNIGGHSVWYCWTAPATDIYVFDTAGSEIDTLLGIYSGTALGSLTLVAENDDFGTNGISAVTFTATAGTNYKVALDGFAGETGNLVLNWAPFRKPRLSIRPLASRRCEISVAGNTGAYALEAANTFTTWTNRATFTISGSPFVYVETENAAFQFYRVLSLPPKD
jgi:hypothetical protein